ncbi:MAG: hypothetical protein WBK51_04875, partial [Polaromonas sp.]
EASGDEGFKGTVELRHSWNANWQSTLFYDFGSISKINKTPFGAAASNSKNLGSVGIGLNATFGKAQIRTALAWRTDGGLPASLPASAVKTPTLLVAASIGF